MNRRHSSKTKSKLYMETTIPSYLTSWPSRDLIIAAHQQVTREWWKKWKSSFEIYVSQLVVDEVKAGDDEAARERLKAIDGMPLLDITEEVERLASSILVSGVIPSKAATDAAHIAIATVHQMEYLMTWNCVHIANAAITKEVAKICRQRGFECPVICTPEELLGEWLLWEEMRSLTKFGVSGKNRLPGTISTLRRSSQLQRNDNESPGARSFHLCKGRN